MYSHLLKNFPQFVLIHTGKGFRIVKKAEVDVFLELSCFFNNPVDVGNLISGSPAFSNTSLNIWKFTVYVLLKGFPYGLGGVKRLRVMRQTRVQSLSREDPLEKEMATHSSNLAWEIPGTEEPGGLQSVALQLDIT